jgi:hypothetical protein
VARRIGGVEDRRDALLPGNRREHGQQIFDANAALVLHQLRGEVEEDRARKPLANAGLSSLLFAKVPEDRLVTGLVLLVLNASTGTSSAGGR